MGQIARATSLTTSLDPRRDGHVLDCSGCLAPANAQSGGKEVGMEVESETVTVSSLRRCLKGEVCLKVRGSYERPGDSS